MSGPRTEAGKRLLRDWRPRYAMEGAASANFREAVFDVEQAAIRAVLGKPEKAGDGVLAALWWALDLIDQYDEHLITHGDSPARVKSFTHQSAKRKARASLEQARAALAASDEAARP